ncbi:MAG TPA: hypothetical protein VF995_01460 [Actinomycetota bacterium]
MSGCPLAGLVVRGTVLEVLLVELPLVELLLVELLLELLAPLEELELVDELELLVVGRTVVVVGSTILTGGATRWRTRGAVLGVGSDAVAGDTCDRGARVVVVTTIPLATARCDGGEVMSASALPEIAPTATAAVRIDHRRA